MKNHSVTKKIYTKKKVLKKRGASLGRNIGIKESKGEFLFLLDSDVVLTDSRILRELLKHFQRDPKIAISEAPYFTKNMSLSERAIACRLPFPNGYTRYISPGSMLIRRDVFNEVGFFDETLGYPYAPGEDQEFAARILRKGYKIFIDTRFINIHLKPETEINARTSIKNNLNFLKSTLTVMPPVHYKIFKAEPLIMKLEVLFALYPLTFFLPLLNVYLLPLLFLPFTYYLYKCKAPFISRCKLSVMLVTYKFIRSTGILLFLAKKLFVNLV